MWDALDITEAEAQGLSELAEHDLALARDFARRALAAEDNDEANRLARSYQRAARSYRQTLAVKVRLKRELAQAAAVTATMQAKAPREKPGRVAIARRIGEVRAALLRLAWDEAERLEIEPDEGEGPCTPAARAALKRQAFAWVRQDLEAVVTRDCVTDHFGEEALDDHVLRLGMEMGLPPDAVARWRDLPDPPDAAMALGLGAPEPQSSA